MSYKVTSTLCMVFLLLFFFSLTSHARPEPAFSDVNTSAKIQHLDDEAEKVMVEESCEGIGEEECLMRRTLVAHIDYIYTQKNKP
ncbi:phytosulfokines [Ziziphus jujuba]|uniref:Phytosulfokine n=2 Tax=Ziziphus jujuba TaxID=326968 RepID=A0A6P6FMA6_ZIZJJ|nr:phytosulfokines [Ziziphus jujuba]KAH7518139.1 hypothetical protein FEM48_Zijuj09G0140100 [Ziziphus jujuba var. spinosa]